MSLVMTDQETAALDKQLAPLLTWANQHRAEAEQLSLDAARLLSCSTDRLDTLQKQGFFKRCWARLNGDAGDMERATTNDIIQMQKCSFRFIHMLQDQNMLMAHSMLTLKNNLFSLSVQEEETRNLVTLLAQKTKARFDALEQRVDQLEVSTNLQGWILTLGESDYDEKFPTENIRLLRVINDFYRMKNDNWNYRDLKFMRVALRTVGLNPKQMITLRSFITSLAHEIEDERVGYNYYANLLTEYTESDSRKFSKFARDAIASPVFCSLHGLNSSFSDRRDVVEELSEELSISTSEALLRLLLRDIKKLNINLEFEFPLAETAIEILGCMRLTEQLMGNRQQNAVTSTTNSAIAIESEQDTFDVKTARVETYLPAAEKGDPVSQYYLSEIYSNGNGLTQKDESKAFMWLQKCAEQGYAPGQRNLGCAYLSGKGVAKDNEKAIYWLKQAADQNDGKAFDELGDIYHTGEIVPKNVDAAFNYYNKGAELGDLGAITSLGVMYMTGSGIEQNVAKAIELWKVASDAGHPSAIFSLANAYRTGQGVPQDYTKALHLFDKVIDDEKVGPGAACWIGVFYEDGNGVPENKQEAIKYYTLAADKGFARGQFCLGFLYHRDKNYSEAIEHLKKAEKRGYNGAQYLLGLMYRDGDGVEQDYSTAFLYVKKAADQGYSPAMHTLACMYEEGQGTTRSGWEALNWHRKAADAGNSRSMLALGHMYREGTFVTEDMVEAQNYYLKAAEKGESSAYLWLGSLHYDGKGDIKQNSYKAFEYFKKAAEAGLPAGLYWIGCMYYEGEGVQRNEEMGKRCLTIAAQNGHEGAQRYLNDTVNYTWKDCAVDVAKIAGELAFPTTSKFISKFFK